MVTLGYHLSTMQRCAGFFVCAVWQVWNHSKWVGLTPNFVKDHAHESLALEIPASRISCYQIFRIVLDKCNHSL
jgi:hypothetical protein